MFGQNWLDLSVGWWTWLHFSVWIEINMVLCRGMEIDWILEWGSKWRDFSGKFEINLIIFCEGSNLTSFLCWDRNRHVFCAGSRVWLCAGRNWRVFGVDIDWLDFCEGGRNWLGFQMRAANRFILVWASKLTWFLRGLSKLTWFQCGGSILYKRTKEVWASTPGQRWLSSSVFYQLRTNNRGPGFKSHRSRTSAFSEMHLHTTARP